MSTDAPLTRDLVIRFLEVALEVLREGDTPTDNPASDPAGDEVSVAPPAPPPPPPKDTTVPATPVAGDATIETFRDLATNHINATDDPDEKKRRAAKLAALVQSFGADRASELAPDALAQAVTALRTLVGGVA